MITLKCSCPAGSHLFTYDEKTEAHILDMIKEHGDMKKITYAPTGITYLVPIAYFLIHDLNAEDLPHLGFEVVKGGDNNGGSN